LYILQSNWDQNLTEISESTNYGSAAEDMFREAVKWTSHVFLGITTLF
jgi:hypothetical protein